MLHLIDFDHILGQFDFHFMRNWCNSFKDSDLEKK